VRQPRRRRRNSRRPREVDDGPWERIAPLLPHVERNPRYPGRPRVDDRKALNGILFVLYTGIPWEFLPQELGYGSGMTCWRRLRDWNAAGVWQRLHELLLAELRRAGLLDFSRAAVDSSHVRAMKGGPAIGPSPVDRAGPAASTTSSSRPTGSRWPRSLPAVTATTSPSCCH
jgi:transposase